MRKFFYYVLGCFLFLGVIGQGWAGDKVLEMSTTTSTQSSGLLDVLLPAFKQDTGIAVKVIAKGTGAAIRDGRDGNVDIIFVHAKAREKEFVEQGFGTKRYAVMYNDFVIVGPKDDPAGIKGSKDVKRALQKIAAGQVPFVSRGDDSGTHTKEQILWRKSGVPLQESSTRLVDKGEKTKITFVRPEQGQRDRYFSIGQGMGRTLTFAEEKQAYTLTDRGTYLKYKLGRDFGLDLEILCQGDEDLHNPYGVIPVNPEKHPHVQYELAEKFARWLVSERAQSLIAEYRLHGEQLFFPEAETSAQ